MLASALLAAVAATPVAAPSVEQVAAALRRSPCWSAAFTQRWVPAGFETGATEGGHLTVAFPAMLRFDYAGAAERVFATDGAVARHVDAAAGSCTAVRIDSGTWGRLPLAAILDPGAAREAFAITATGRTLTLAARKPTPELATVEVEVGENGLPQRVTVIDGGGNRNEFSFTAWSPGPEPAADLFRPALAGASPCDPEG
jgi:outer membrane lipoprotein-sorting protein